MHLFKRRTLFLIFALTVMLVLCGGCSKKSPEAKDPFSFLDSPAECTVTFPSLDETAVPVVCRTSLSPEEISFSVEEPARSRGLTVSYQNGCCTLKPTEGIPVSLSEPAAEPLTAFCRVLMGGASGAIRYSDDGEEILIEENGGILHLSKDGVPCAVESPAADGTMRKTVIADWVQKEATSRTPNPSET